MRLVRLQGSRVCWECFDLDPDCKWRDDIIGVVIGNREAGDPRGLRLALCPRHFKKLNRLKIVKQKRIIKRRKRR